VRRMDTLHVLLCKLAIQFAEQSSRHKVFPMPPARGRYRRRTGSARCSTTEPSRSQRDWLNSTTRAPGASVRRQTGTEFVHRGRRACTGQRDFPRHAALAKGNAVLRFSAAHSSYPSRARRQLFRGRHAHASLSRVKGRGTIFGAERRSNNAHPSRCFRCLRRAGQRAQRCQSILPRHSRKRCQQVTKDLPTTNLTSMTVAAINIRSATYCS
jgi:hypothetical protein